MTSAITQLNARWQLADQLRKRPTTQRVAYLIEQLNLPLNAEAKFDLHRLAEQYNPAWERYFDGDYQQVSDASQQLNTLIVLFHDFFEGPDVLPAENDIESLSGVARDLLDRLGFANYATPGEALSALRTARPRGGQHKLRKQLRFLKTFDAKLTRMRAHRQLMNATRQANSRLSYMIDPARLDDRTLAFISYLTARANRRSEFVFSSQSKAQDSLSDALFELLGDDTPWDQVALIKPTVDVISRCSPEAQGQLAGLFHNQMRIAATELGKLWPTLPARMRTEMVMVKGVDSSSWNAYAGALNTMRSAWLSAMQACGLESVFETYLPGKAPRLMASDLAWGFRETGKDLHEDTRLFSALPRPWEVVLGEAQLGRAEMILAVQAAGIDLNATGWLGPRIPHQREHPTPDPALVHGVRVGDPCLAEALRRAGVFSGKSLRYP